MTATDPTAPRVGLLVFPGLTLLDLVGPLQVLTSVPSIDVHLVWRNLDPVGSDAVVALTPTMSFADCPPLDVVCVPGGYGTDALLSDAEVLGFLRGQGGARYITSVCTGALVLGAAGLLDGYRATTHWTAMEHLAAFGAVPTPSRVCIDRNRITGGGVTAGIDFALTLVMHMLGREVAEAVQLRLEYAPQPPLDAGSPGTAPPQVLESYLDRTTAQREARAAAVARAALECNVRGAPSATP